MKKKIFTITIVLTVFFNCMTVYGANESQKDKIDYQQKEFQLKEEYINFKNDMKDEWNKKQEQLNKQEIKVNAMWFMLKNIGVILSVLGIGSVTWIIKKNKNYIEDSMKDIINGRKDLISNILEKQSLEYKLTKYKKILIISNNCRNEELIHKYLLKKFKNYIDKSMEEEIKEKELKKFDLIIFNKLSYEFDDKNSNDEENLSYVKEIIKENNNNKAIYFWFDNKNLDINNICSEFKDKELHINYAKSYITLYENILQALKFQDKFLD